MLSPIKIILLIAVIGIVFLVARQFRKPEGEGRKTTKNANKDTDTATELVKCPDCGTYVSSLSEHKCHN